MKISFLILLVLLSGCSTGGKHNNPKYTYPDSVSPIFQKAKDSSKECIESKGVKLKETDFPYVIEVIKGEKKIQGIWCFRSEKWGNQYVAGLTFKEGNRYRSLIPSNPQTGGEINFNVLKHEFAHFWLMSNKNDYKHDPKFKSCFYNWYEMNIKGLQINSFFDEICVIYNEDE